MTVFQVALFSKAGQYGHTATKWHLQYVNPAQSLFGGYFFGGGGNFLLIQKSMNFILKQNTGKGQFVAFLFDVNCHAKTIE